VAGNISLMPAQAPTRPTAVSTWMSTTGRVKGLFYHPLIRHKLGVLRRNDTSTRTFRDLTREITCLLAYEAFRHLELEKETVQGWAGPVEVEKISGKKVAVVPILRAGIGMLQGVLDLIPSARVKRGGRLPQRKDPGAGALLP
jgi:uracil phosphoribosyltransferase